MKRILFIVAAVATMGFYAFPLLLAQADTTTSSPAAEVAAQGNGVQQVSVGTNILYLHITAYASVPDETSDHPFITASGEHVRDGIVATNLLPFGTRIQIPALFGQKIFTVEDRMNARMVGRVDIWMPSVQQAVIFGSNYADVVVLGPEPTSTAVADAGSL